MISVAASQVECIPQPVYKYRQDGKPGREVLLKLSGHDRGGELSIHVTDGKKQETIQTRLAPGQDTVRFLLPEGIGVRNTAHVQITVRQDSLEYQQQVTIPPMRYWNVYLYNHAHVDVGYTNTHKNVEILHTTNILEGIKLAEATADYPEGSRFVWNPEVSWPLERLWVQKPELRGALINAVKKGHLALDASYLNVNTSVCSDEELFHLFDFTRGIQQVSGRTIDSFQQVDIPGMTWGIIPVMVQCGVRYVMQWSNTDRAGQSHEGLDGYPVWWVGPDKTSKILFFQPGKYGNSGSMTKGGETGRPWLFQKDPTNVPTVIKTGHANVDFTPQLTQLEKERYPYDFCVLSWSLWDNCPLDADIPHAVRQWNESHAYPKIIISNAHDIMSMIETQWGDKLPVVTGDYTEYWTDGLGTAAKLTAINRNAREQLAQAETLASMLRHPDQKAMRTAFDEAWRYISLASEHTWCAENPKHPYFQEAIWKDKQSYFHEASKRVSQVLDEALTPVATQTNPTEFLVFNTQSWSRGGPVVLPKVLEKSQGIIVTQEGNRIETFRDSSGELIGLIPEVPAFGYQRLRIVNSSDFSIPSSGQPCFYRQDGTISNGLVSVKIDFKTGNIVSLTKDLDPYNYIDPQTNGGANSFCWLPANKDEPESDKAVNVEFVEKNDLAIEVRATSRARGCRQVTRSVRIIKGQPWVEITNTVDKLPLEEKDSIHFGFGFNLPNAKTRFDIPWGVVEVEKDQWKQANRNWLAIQRWLNMSTGERGILWCSLDAPLFEYGGRFANIAMGWGAKGNWITRLAPSSTIYSWVMNNHWHTNFPLTQDGPVTFRYRIQPHNGMSDAEANRFGLNQAQPLIAVPTNGQEVPRPIIAIDHPKVCVTIIKPLTQQGSYIVRLRSLSATTEQVKLTFPSEDPQQASICHQGEEHGSSLLPNPVATIKPYGMLTLRLDFPPKQ